MSNTKNKTETSAIDQLRKIRDKVNADIKDLSYEQLIKYMEEQKMLHPNANWQK